jgi:hypothetical protein
MYDENDDAAAALRVVSVQKEQGLRVPILENDDAKKPAGASSAHEGAHAFKAGSPLPDDRIDPVNATQLILARCGSELYAIDPDDLRASVPEVSRRVGSRTGVIDLRETIIVGAAFSRDAVPELIRTIGTSNIVRYDGWFYLVPQRCGSIRWGEEDPRAFSGVVVAATAREAVAIAESDLADVTDRGTEPALQTNSEHSAGSVPMLVKTVGNYNIVAYEGWYYGLPHALGPVQLEDVDVIEMKGVLRDLSADVVEREILEAQR